MEARGRQRRRAGSVCARVACRRRSRPTRVGREIRGLGRGERRGERRRGGSARLEGAGCDRPRRIGGRHRRDEFRRRGGRRRVCRRRGRRRGRVEVGSGRRENRRRLDAGRSRCGRSRCGRRRDRSVCTRRFARGRRGSGLRRRGRRVGRRSRRGRRGGIECRRNGGGGRVGRGRRRRGRGRGRRLGRGRRRGPRGRRRRHEHRQERERIEVALRVGGGADPEVDVRHRDLRRAARPDRSDHVAFGHGCAAWDRDRAEVGQRDREAVGGLDRDRAAVRGDGAGEAHRPARGSVHRRARVGTQVDTAVLAGEQRVVVVEREALEHRAIDRPGPGTRRGHPEDERQDEQSEQPQVDHRLSLPDL